MGESKETPVQDEPNILHMALILIGGGLVGTGIVNLYWGFGHAPDATNASGSRIAFNGDFASVGFSGLDNINILSSAHIAVPLIVMGVLMMVAANATAWRRTGGY